MGSKRFTVILVMDSDGEIDIDRSKIYTDKQRGGQAIAELFHENQKMSQCNPRKRIKFSAVMLSVDDSEPLPEMPKVQQLSLLEVEQDGT